MSMARTAAVTPVSMAVTEAVIKVPYAVTATVTSVPQAVTVAVTAAGRRDHHINKAPLPQTGQKVEEVLHPFHSA